VAWEVEYTDEFGEWFESLTAEEQISIDAYVQLLIEAGPHLPHPYSSQIKGARTSHMRELRIQHAGDPYRVLYAFDPKRSALLLTGGNKGGDDRWYTKNVPVADRLYEEHIRNLE